MLHTLICAAGSQTRWERSGGPGLKQLIHIGSETLIERTYRLACERSYEVTTLVRDPSLECWTGLNPAAPAGEAWMGEMGKFLDGRPYWPASGEVLILYGDVFYGALTLRRIFEHVPDQPTIYGRAQAGRSESFGFRFRVPDDVAEVERVARECADLGMVDRGGPWRWFMRRHTDLTRWTKAARRELTDLATEENGWVEVGHDETDDFDHFKDLQRWRQKFWHPQKGLTMAKTNEYVYKDGQSQGAIAGTEMDKILAKDPDWTLVGGRGAKHASVTVEGDVASVTVTATPEPDTTTPADGGSGDGSDGGSGSGDAELDLSEYNRKELNALAAKLGIEGAEQLANKPKVIAAIEAVDREAVIAALREATTPADGGSGE